jgi:AcrR family transcriptional regulator
MTPVERQLRADAARNRRAIVEAAEAEFRARGVDASIDAIADRAGVGVGTLYRNYATKDELMRAILAARAEPLVAEAREALSAPDPGAAFFGFLRRVFAASGDFKALADSLAEAGLDFIAAKEAVGRELMAAVRELFSRAQLAGAVRSDVTVDDLHMLVGGLSHSAHSAADAGQMARCVELVFDALRPQSALPGHQSGR